MRLRTISQSKIKSWLYCPAGFYEQHILKLDAYNPNFELGTDWHTAIENYHRGLPYDEKLIENYTKLIPADHVAEMEMPFEVVLRRPSTGEPLPIPFTGRIDQIKRGVYLGDTKTSEQAWSQGRVDDVLGKEGGIQATIYLYAWYTMYGEILPFDFTIIRKYWTEKNRFEPVMVRRTTRTLEDFETFWLYAYKIIQDILTATEYPCRCRDRAHALIGAV